MVDLRRDRVDVALRHGLGRYPGLRAVWLMAPVLVPVASPALLGRRKNAVARQSVWTFPCCMMPTARTGRCGWRRMTWRSMRARGGFVLR